jgi:DNA modification methylase
MYLIRTYTDKGDLVLDNCMGSGSTGVACKATSREFIGIEIDPSYFQIAKDRIHGVIPEVWKNRGSDSSSLMLEFGGNDGGDTDRTIES